MGPNNPISAQAFVTLALHLDPMGNTPLGNNFHLFQLPALAGRPGVHATHEVPVIVHSRESSISVQECTCKCNRSGLQ